MHVIDAAPSGQGWALVLHGGAGGPMPAPEQQAAFEAGLRDAYAAGRAVLVDGGTALDGVCAAVTNLEDNPLFNAGRGAALTSSAEAELDAAVMTGRGRAGAVAVSRFARNPVLAARKVLEETGHVLLVGPSRELVEDWGLSTVDSSYFVTEGRLAQLAAIRDAQAVASRHGTVGAVAVDLTGHLAAATSTGGMANQSDRRVGDTPIIGGGTYARDGIVAVSCTGVGEAFIEGVVAHEIASRVRYAGQDLAAAAAGTVLDEVEGRGADGGVIAVTPDGRVAIAHNSTHMYAAYEADGAVVVLT